jgi:Holliday junction resolvase RusA-like endonuclease
VIEYSMTVYGTPIGQGNLDAVPKRVGTNPATGKAILDWTRPRLVHQNAKDLKPWRQSVSLSALEARGRHREIDRECAVRVDIVFYFQRPKSLPKCRTRQITKPDIDRLVRATLDALTGIAFADDAQVDETHLWKRFAGGVADPLGAAGTPRTIVRVAAQEEAPVKAERRVKAQTASPPRQPARAVPSQA